MLGHELLADHPSTLFIPYHLQHPMPSTSCIKQQHTISNQNQNRASITYHHPLSITNLIWIEKNKWKLKQFENVRRRHDFDTNIIHWLKWINNEKKQIEIVPTSCTLTTQQHTHPSHHTIIKFTYSLMKYSHNWSLSSHPYTDIQQTSSKSIDPYLFSPNSLNSSHYKRAFLLTLL